jgi:Dyp-type peroxidase family
VVLRSGAKQGPARGWDIAGAAAGVATVLVLTVFVIVAGTRDGYSHVNDTISQLGASGTSGANWFVIVNWVGAVLIIVFALGAHRRLAVGLATGAFLGGVALGAVLIGLFRCSGKCPADTRDAHGLAASFTAAMITAFLIAAACALYHSTVLWFRRVTFACMGLNVAFLIALLLVVATDSGGVGLFERLFWASAYAWVLAASWAIIAATRRRSEIPPFDPALLQHKILRSPPTWTHSAYGFCSINDADAAKRWLCAAVDPGSGVVRPDDGTKSTGSVTLAFTCAGLRRLGVDYRRDDPFSQGMQARAVHVGDVGESAPEHWQCTWHVDDLHLLVWVEAEDDTARGALLERVRELEGGDALTWIDTEFATSILNGDRQPLDHRGFRDGISQPWVRLKDRKPDDGRRSGGGTLDPFDEWRPIAVGEFVLGERDESDDVSRVPEPTAIFEHGSFLVVRKLAQDLVGLQHFVDTQAAQLRLDPTDLEERLLGRRRDGRRLDQTTKATDGAELNDFTFRHDADGLVCPLGAHIRRGNPRDALGFGMLMSARHRIIRRGNTYSADARAPAGWEKGLMFIAVNARIDDQFEFIQRLWINDGDRQRLGASRDIIAGSSLAASTAVLQFDGRSVVTAPNPIFVRTMGGEYFFAPSMSGLRALAT